MSYTIEVKEWTVKEEDLESGITFLNLHQHAWKATAKSHGSMEYFGLQGYSDIVIHHMNYKYKFVET